MKKPDFEALKKAKDDWSRKQKLSIADKFALMNGLRDFAVLTGAFEKEIKFEDKKEKVDFIKRLHALRRTAEKNSR